MALIRCAECKTKVSDKAAACPKCGAPVEISKKKQKRQIISGCGCVFILLVVGVIIAAFVASDKDSRPRSPSTPTSRSAVPAPKKTAVPMPKYEVVDRDIYDAPIKTQIVMHAVVSGTVTETGLRQLLQKLYAEAQATRGFKHHGGKPTHVAIYLYTSLQHFKSGMGQWIGMLSKIGKNAKVDISVKSELISQLDAKPEVKHGLSESKRIEIFRALVRAEDRADADAQRTYPLPDPLKPGYSQDKATAQVMKQAEAIGKLTEKYRAEVIKRYRITEEQLTKITVEALEKNWPMP